MRFSAIPAIVIMLYAAVPLAAEQTVDPQLLEIRATQALTQGDYARALPILEKLAEAFAEQPQRQERIEEQIRLARRNIERAGQDAEQSGDAHGRVIDLLLPFEQSGPQTAEQRQAHAPPVDGETRRLTIRQLGNFEYDEFSGGNIPPDVQRLSGTRVQVGGFMIPMEQAARFRRFVLVPDLFACCFGQPPQVHHSITVTAPAGRPVDYSPHQIIVEGILRVEERMEDGWIMSVFEIEASRVRPAER